jgi:hypothetical protein
MSERMTTRLKRLLCRERCIVAPGVADASRRAWSA